MSAALSREGPAARLHSRYNPRAEAERYIDALDLHGEFECFILIEPGLGYLVPALRKRYAHSKIIVLHADSRFRDAAAPGVPTWYPDSAETVQSFLEREMPGSGAASVRIIEWRPSLLRYGEACRALVSEAAVCIKRAEAGLRTAAAFGGKWVRNFFRNTALVRRALRFRPVNSPLIITGSGPGLESALPRIAAAQGAAFILAASSSVAALRQGGIVPDMVISTDGGSWALSHWYACLRGNHRIPRLAAALSAALPSQCGALPFLVLNDGSLWQSLVLGALKIPSVIIPARGTVTASALELALVLSSGSIFLAGLDLSVQDIRTHARPYGFDHLFYGAASRLRPVYSQCFVRSGDICRGGSHEVYAGWFKNRVAGGPERVFALGRNHEVFARTEKTLPEGAGQNNGAAWTGCFETVPLDRAPEAGRGAEALIRALDDPRYAKTLGEELSPLLFPGEKNIRPAALAEAIQNACRERKNHG